MDWFWIFEWYPQNHSKGSDIHKLEADLAEMARQLNGKCIISWQGRTKPKMLHPIKTAWVIQEKQVYEFSIWNTVTITKTCINTLNSNCSAVALLNRKWANSQDLATYLLFSEWKKNTVPIHVTSEQRRGPLTHTVCWSDHPPLYQGGSKTEEQVSL